MALCRTGYFWSASSKKLEKHPSEWIPAVLELAVEDEKLNLIVHPNDPIYEAVDEEERTLKFSLEMYRRCWKLRRNRSVSKDTTTQIVKSPPKYQLLLQKRLLFKGQQLKIGFDDPTSQQQFYDRLKNVLRGSGGERKFKRTSKLRSVQKKGQRDCQRFRERVEENAVKDIDNFMTDNQIYEAHTSGAVKVRVIPTDLSSRLNISGIYLLEVKGLDIMLLDYINLMLLHKWSFRSVRSFGYNASKLYLLTGSCCPGGRGLLCFFTEKGEMLMEHLVELMRLAARDRRLTSTPDQSATPTTVSGPGQRSNSDRLGLEQTVVSPAAVAHSAPITRASTPPSPKRQIVADLTSSLQTFCRPHCCTTADATSAQGTGSLERPVLVDQKEATTDDFTSSEECLTRDETETEEESTEDMSLTEIRAANATGTDAGFTTSSDADLTGHCSISDEAYVNSQRILKAREDEEARKGAASRRKTQSTTKLGFKGQNLKKCLQTFFGQTNVDGRSEAESTHAASTSDDPVVNVKSASFREDVFSNVDVAKEAAAAIIAKPTKHASVLSNKDVQLIKWRDLPAKREYSCPQALLLTRTSSRSRSSNSTSSSRSYRSDRPTSDGPSRSSDIINFVLDQGKPASDTADDPGRTSITSLSASLRAKEADTSNEVRQPSALLSDLVASTVF
ncbi:hypothetical protein SprV_0200817300 [Sparganum proliferum]